VTDATTGHWQPRSPDWWEIEVINCSLCGQMIPRDLWVVEVNGRRHVFCGPACERLYRDYWLPRHGPGTPDPGAPRS